MELKCPQCGKWMAVSQEELMTHDCQVVCPQCLAVCQYENGSLVVRDDSDAPYRHTASVSTAAQEDTSRFCHSCGRKLPEGISFCPYCGVDLKAPFDETAAAKPEQEKKSTPAPAPAPATPKPATKEKHQPDEPAPQTPSARFEDKLRTMPHHYKATQPRLHQNGAMPGLAFKVFAYIIIALLLILLVYIIIAGLSIEPAM